MKFKDVTVLVVDDSKVMRRIILKQLHRMGFNKIHEASSGRNALRLLAQDGGFDLILSDCSMPGLSGLDLLREVRSVQETQDIPFVLLTAEAQLYTILMAFKARVSSYMTKPFTPEYFRYIISRAIKGNHGDT